MTFVCQTCGEAVRNVAAARKHAKQGYRTQREAFAAGELHSLHLVESSPQRVRDFESVCGPWFAGDLPEDIVQDIRLCDSTARVTVEDARAYLATMARP